VGRAVFNLQIRPDNSPSADLPPIAEEDQDRTLRFNMPVHYNHQTRRLSS
jgi:hypothetical protein